MSREERRAYRRMMKNNDPYAPPVQRGAAGRQQADRLAKRRAARAAARGPADTRLLAPRYVALTLVVAAVVGLLAFSILWPNMPFALYVGIGAALAWIVVAIGARAILRRGSRGGGPAGSTGG